MDEDKEKYSRPYILSIEDNPEDFEIIARALRKVAPQRRIQHCESGDDALQFLRQHQEAPVDGLGLPDVILLDLNLPGTDGRDILKIIKNDQKLQRIPVIVFSTSNNEKDIEVSYTSGANAYLRKPSTLEEFVDIAQTINKFWFDTCLVSRNNP